MDRAAFNATLAEFERLESAAHGRLMELWAVLKPIVEVLHKPHRMPNDYDIRSIENSVNGVYVSYEGFEGERDSFYIPNDIIDAPDALEAITAKRERDAAEKAAAAAAATEARERADYERLAAKFGPRA